MKQAFNINVKSNNYIRVPQEKRLKKFGLTKISSKQFAGILHSEKVINKIRIYCEKHRLKLLIDNEYAHRSTNYRNVYFKNHQANKRGQYRCVYCGKWVNKNKITIDHLYPVNKVSSDIKLQKKLKKSGINTVNSATNLVAACASCNSRKSDKMGIWILKGKLGKHNSIWVIRKFLLVLIILFFFFVVLYLLWENNLLPYNNFINPYLNSFFSFFS